MVRHAPWEVWDCTCSEARVFWGLLLCAWTVHTYLKCLHLVASEKYDVHTGSYWTMQFISFVKVVSAAYINKAKKQAELKSTIQRSKPLREARLEYEWWTTSCYFRGTTSALFGGLRQTTTCCPPSLPPPTHLAAALVNYTCIYWTSMVVPCGIELCILITLLHSKCCNTKLPLRARLTCVYMHRASMYLHSMFEPCL